MKLTQALYHAHNVAVFRIYLFDLVFVTLISTEANFMAAREFMLMRFNIVGNLLCGMFIHVANGTLDSGGDVCASLLRCRFFVHGCADGVRRVVRSGILRIIVTGPRAAGRGGFGERALKMALLSLDREVLF
jgi:hypothetical protein